MNLLRTCKNCRKSHLKCNGKLPCSGCILRNQHCEYPVRKKKAASQTTLQKQLQIELLKLQAEYERLSQSEKFWRSRVLQMGSQQVTTTTRNELGQNVNMFVVLGKLYWFICGDSGMSGLFPEEVKLIIQLFIVVVSNKNPKIIGIFAKWSGRLYGYWGFVFDERFVGNKV